MSSAPPDAPCALQPAPFFLSLHAPVGAWASLVLGKLGGGVLIRSGGAETAADLLVGVRRGGACAAFPLVRDAGRYLGWRFLEESAISHRLSPCIEEFAADAFGVTFRIYTPHAALPNPKRGGNLQFAAAPGILMELSIDNSASDEPATGFLGLGGLGGRSGGPWLRPLDWSSKALRGVGCGSEWLLAAAAVKNEIFTVQAEDSAAALAGDAAIDPAGNIGGVGVRVDPRISRSVFLCFAWYAQGMVTQGIEARPMYAHYFAGAQPVANFLLQNAARVRESCESFDARIAGAMGDADPVRIFSRALRSYAAQSQVVESPEGQAAAVARPPAGAGTSAIHFAFINPADRRRNPLETIGDRLPFELFRNPWVVRNVFDLAAGHYAYHDRLEFRGGDAAAAAPESGGITFMRDFGCGSAFAPAAVPGSAGAGGGAFDAAGDRPGWSGGKFATEILLNSIYMLTGYALVAQDTPWAKTRLPFARELLLGLENRDHPDPAQRTGILKADSVFAGGAEQTVFAAEPGALPALALARGNLYMAVKTFCANLLLTTYFQHNNDLHSADHAYAFARKTASAITAAFDPAVQALPVNLRSPAEYAGTRLLAAIEPLALPTWLGLTSTLQEYFPELFSALFAHLQTCLKPLPEGCFDPAGPALRLMNSSAAPISAKIIPVIFVAERLFGIDVEASFPGLWKTLADSLGDSAAPADSAGLALSLFLKSSV